MWHVLFQRKKGRDGGYLDEDVCFLVRQCLVVVSLALCRIEV